MGWSFRKSIKMGPVRMNLSKSGIGWSTGVKGFRISTGPRGTRLRSGVGPFRYTKTLSRRRSRDALQEDSNVPQRSIFGLLRKLVVGVFALFIGLIASIAIVAGSNGPSNRSDPAPVAERPPAPRKVDRVSAVVVPILTSPVPTPQKLVLAAAEATSVEHAEAVVSSSSSGMKSQWMTSADLRNTIPQAESAISSARRELEDAKAKSLTVLKEGPAYREAAKKVDDLRAAVEQDRKVGLSTVSQNGQKLLDAKTVVTKMEREVHENDASVSAAKVKFETAVAALVSLKSQIASTEKEERAARELAITKQSEEKASKRQADLANQRLGGFSSPSTGSPSASGGGSVHVHGYTKKDGTVVRSYTRRR